MERDTENVIPNHVITATEATTATKRKTLIIRYFLSGIGDNGAGDGPSCSGVGDINANEDQTRSSDTSKKSSTA